MPATSKNVCRGHGPLLRQYEDGLGSKNLFNCLLAEAIFKFTIVFLEHQD